jgi:GrpB-like predicted nucleotidyltransferase (UPF0157 family)
MYRNYAGRTYYIEPYNPDWALQFAHEAEKVRSVFGADAITIEHVGSTSVPGLAGKPVIDILVVVHEVADIEQHVSEMALAGYINLGHYVSPDSYLFIRGDINNRICNVHVFPKNHSHTREMPAFRDYLISHPDEMNTYSQLKQDLFQKYPNDYAQYRKEKDVYVKDLTKRVLQDNTK